MSRNSELKSSENPRHKSNDNIEKNDKANFFQTLEINQRLAQTASSRQMVVVTL